MEGFRIEVDVKFEKGFQMNFHVNGIHANLHMNFRMISDMEIHLISHVKIHMLQTHIETSRLHVKSCEIFVSEVNENLCFWWHLF